MVRGQQHPGLHTRNVGSEFYQWKGSPAPTQIERTTTLAFQNIHGLYARTQHFEDKISELVHNMDENNVSLLGISEHNIALTNFTWKQRLHDAIQQSRPGRISAQFHSGPETDDQGRLMGGTGIVVKDELTGRLEPKDNDGDPMGRWSMVHLRRRGMAPITVISIYQVCTKPTNQIGDTSWHQQRRYLDLQHREEHPRKAFMHDLISVAKHFQEKHHSLIIGGDWNDWLDSRRSQLLQLCTTLNLVDPWLLYNPQDRDFATYEHGQHRIDSVFISPELQEAVMSIRYSPGSLLCNTDHRAILVDFNTVTLFGTTSTPLSRVSARGVRSNDKQSVTTFIESMHQHLLSQNAFARAEALQYTMTSSQLVEQLDMLVGEAGDIAEQRCRRRRQPWFSSQLVSTRHIVSLLRHYAKGLQNNADRSRSIYQRLRIHNCNVVLPTEIPKAQELVKEYEGKLHALIHKAADTRRQELEGRAQITPTPAARALRSINQHEQNAKTWRILAFMSGQTKEQQLNRLDIPQSWPDTPHDITNGLELEDPKQAQQWKTITDPKAIESFLMLRNCQHFGQAHGTPFTVPPLNRDVDWGGVSTTSAELLSGSYTNTQNLSDMHQTFFKNCCASTALDSVDALIATHEFEGKIKVWNERTTTSPSGRHLGRYKALYAPSKYEVDSEDHVVFSGKQMDIINLLIRIMNHCIITGRPLTRWCQVVNTMIFKERGVYQIHRLRVIHIFEADLNLLYAVKWRSLMHHAEKKGIINSGQYGGRPGYEATSMALLEELRIDISYSTRQTLVTFDNDAASCYDRMIPNLVSIVNCKYGLHKDITHLHGQILHQTQYRARTAAGLTETSYRNTPETPLYGTGQGAGNSPTIWLLTSSLLFDTFDKVAHGAIFSSQDGHTTTKLGLSGFVDDTNAVVNTHNPQAEVPIDHLLALMQHDAQIWCNLLHLSGGKLEISKCSYHALQFNFRPDGTPLPVTNSQLPPMELYDPTTNQQYQVRFMPSEQAHKILGHWKSPADPQQKAQLKALVSKANTLSLLIAASPLTRQGAKLAYNAKYVASLRYILPQCWFKHTQLFKSEKTSMARIFAKCGYARTMPQALLYTPTTLAGAGFLHWATLQGEGQVTHFIKHWRTNTTVSVLMRISVSWAQWQAGTGVSILKDVLTPLPHVESRWLPSLRDFLALINAHIELDQDYVPATERHGDIHLMDYAMNTGEFDAKELCLLNYCRLYLHVVTISDLFNASGNKLLPCMYECVRPPWFDPTIQVAIQHRPSHYQRRFQWKRLCRMVCCDDLRAGQVINLKQWTQPISKLRLRREAYKLKDTLYIWRDKSYWQARPHGTLAHQYELLNPTEWLPTDESIPIDISNFQTPRRCTIFIHQESCSAIVPPTVQNIYDFGDYVLTLPMWERHLLEHVTWHLQPFEILHTMQTQWAMDTILMIVSDGSSIEHTTMSFGLAIGSSDGQLLLEGKGPASGRPSSHRAECTGCLAGGLILKHLQRYTAQRIPAFIETRVISDNNSMINSLNARRKFTECYPNTTLRPDWDLLEEIHATYHQLAIPQYSFEWVKGHQDQDAKTPLAIEAKFNIYADQLASDYITMVASQYRPITPMTPHTRCTMYVAQHAQHGNYTQQIRLAASLPAYHEYLQKKNKWTSETLAGIDWDSFQMACRNFQSNEVQLLKLVYDKLPTNVQKSRYNKATSAQCYFCTEDETFEHLCVSSCNARSSEFRQQLMHTIQEYFTQQDTPQIFNDTFCAVLEQWFTQNNKDSHTTEQPPSQRLKHQQQSIGGYNMCRGFLSNTWRKLYMVELRHEEMDRRENTSTTGIYEGESDEETPSAPNTTPCVTCEENMEPPRPSVCRSPTRFLSGLIKIMWQAMSELWQQHLAYLNNKENNAMSQAKAEELKTQIRELHKFQDKTLACHRTRYFFQDLDQYLANTPIAQMKRYVARYRPVILSSLRQATKIATQSLPITTFMQVISRPRNDQRQLHQAMEEPRHWKHTRIRQLKSGTSHPITNYFKRKQPNSPPPP